MGLKRTVDPAAVAVSLTRAKKQVELLETESAHDAHLNALIGAATEHVEQYTRRSLITQTWRLTLDAFPCEIILPRPPVQSVNSITYVDDDGATQTLSSSLYQVCLESSPARIVPAYNEVWPTVRNIPEAVQVTYVAGYGAASTNVPEQFKQVILLLVGHWFEHREAIVSGTSAAEVPLGAIHLMDRLQVGTRLGTTGVTM